MSAFFHGLLTISALPLCRILAKLLFSTLSLFCLAQTRTNGLKCFSIFGQSHLVVGRGTALCAWAANADKARSLPRSAHLLLLVIHQVQQVQELPADTTNRAAVAGPAPAHQAASAHTQGLYGTSILHPSNPWGLSLPMPEGHTERMATRPPTMDLCEAR